MPTIDPLGIWQELSSSPIIAADDWQTFPNDCKNGRLFRLKFNLNWEDWNERMGFRSFGYLRFAYRDDSGEFNLVTASVRLYPKQEQMLWEIPTLLDLQDNSWTIRKAEFKRVWRRYPWPIGWEESGTLNFDNLKPPILDWGLSIEYLINA